MRPFRSPPAEITLGWLPLLFTLGNLFRRKNEFILDELDGDEKDLAMHWEKAKSILQKDLAYIWTDGVQKELKYMSEDLEKIKYVLIRVNQMKASRFFSQGNPFVEQERQTIARLFPLLRSQSMKDAGKWAAAINKEITELLRESQRARMRMEPRFANILKLQQLRRWGFEAGKHPLLAGFLCRHWEDVQAIASAHENEPFRQRLVEAWQFRDFSKIFKNRSRRHFFEYTLKNISWLVNEQTWQGIVQMVTGIEGGAYKTLRNLPAIRGFITPQVWPHIVHLAVKTGNHSDLVLGYTLPAIKHILNEQAWPMVGRTLVTIHGEGSNADSIFQFGIPAMRRIITEQNFPAVADLLVSVAKQSPYSAFFAGLPALENALNEQTLPALVADLKKIVSVAGKNSSYLFYRALPALKPLINERTWPIIFPFILKEIAPSKQRMTRLSYLEKIPSRVWTYFEDFLIAAIELAPRQFLSIASNVRKIMLIEGDLTKELIALARIGKSFHLILTSTNVGKVKAQDVEQLYALLSERMGRTPNLEKLRKEMGKLGTSHQQAAIASINIMLRALAIDYFSSLTNSQVRDVFQQFCGVPLPPELSDNEDILNALQVAKKCDVGKNQALAREFIRNACLLNMYPFQKGLDRYPLNHPKNQRFMFWMRTLRLNSSPWIDGFERSYDLQLSDVSGERGRIIAQHVNEVIAEYRGVGMQVSASGIESELAELQRRIEAAQGQVKEQLINTKKDIQRHLNAIRGLQQADIARKKGGKVKVYIELDPLKVLQMGNVVSGSCLSVDSFNSWTTVTNAVDVNKHVLYMANESGSILGRVLITLNNKGEILQYGVYTNAYDIDVPALFRKYLAELAQTCRTRIGSRGKTALLVGEDWYAGTEIQ